MQDIKDFQILQTKNKKIMNLKNVKLYLISARMSTVLSGLLLLLLLFTMPFPAVLGLVIFVLAVLVAIYFMFIPSQEKIAKVNKYIGALPDTENKRARFFVIWTIFRLVIAGIFFFVVLITSGFAWLLATLVLAGAGMYIMYLTMTFSAEKIKATEEYLGIISPDEAETPK